MKVDSHSHTIELEDGERSLTLTKLVSNGYGGYRVVVPAELHRPEMQEMDGGERAAIGAFAIALALLLVTQLFAVWPAVVAAATDPPTRQTVGLLFGAVDVTFAPDVALLVMVTLVGALGSLVELIRRFTTHAGRGDLSRRWTWWYVLRPVQGAALALVFYFVLRGGLLGVDSAVAVNPYGIAATAGVVGLFAQHAISRLNGAFDAFFGKPEDSSTNIKPKVDGANSTNGSNIETK